MADRNNDNKSSNSNNKKESIKGKQNNTFDMFDINVKKAQKDVKEVFDDAKKQLDDYKKSSEDMTKKMLKSISSQYDDFYDDLEKKHKTFVDNAQKMSEKLTSQSGPVSNGNPVVGSSGSGTLGSTSTGTNAANSDNMKQFNKMVNDFNKQQSKLNNNLDSSNASIKGIANKLLNAKQDDLTDTFNTGIDKISSQLSDGSLSMDGATKEFQKLSGEYSAGTAKLGKAAVAIQALTVVLDGLKVIFDKWVSRFFDGVDRIVSVYEETYSKVAVITDTNQKNYQDWQNQASKELQANNLAQNITVSQTMKHLDNITSRGITDFQKATQMAMENSINSTLAPYVDVTTEAYTDLQTKLGKEFTDKITGMGGYLAEMSGSNRVFKSSINDVIDKLAPVALNAEKELMGDDAYAMVEKLVAEGGMTEKQAVQLVSDATNAVSDKYGSLINGNTAQQVAVATGQANDVGSAIRSMLGTGTLAQNGNEIAQGAANYSLGTNAYFSQNSDIEKLLDTANTISNDVKNSDKSSQKSYEKMLGGLKDNKYTTAKAQKDNYAENIATSVATFKERFPDAYDMLATISKGVVAIAGSLIGGQIFKGLGNLLKGKGFFSGGGKIMSGLKSFGSKLLSGMKGLGSKLLTGLKGLGSKILPAAKSIGSKLVSGGSKLLSGAKGLGGKAISGVKSLAPKAAGLLGKSISIGQTGLTTTVGGVAGGVVGTVMAVKDAIGGAKKSKEWLGSNSAGAKVASGIGGALGGTGPGIGEKGAKAGDVAKNTLGNTAKGAGIGMAIGSIIPGVGTAIGGAIGAGVGALTGLIGGKRIAKMVSAIGAPFKAIGKGLGKVVKGGAKLVGKALGKTTLGKAVSGIKKVWGDSSKSFGQKLLGTAGAIFKANPLVRAGGAIAKGLKKGIKGIAGVVKKLPIGKVAGEIGNVWKDKNKSLGQKILGTAGAIFKTNPIVKAGGVIAKGLKKGIKGIAGIVKKTPLGKAASEIGNVWKDKNKSFGQKLLGTAGAIIKQNPFVKIGSKIAKGLKKNFGGIAKVVKKLPLGKALSDIGNVWKDKNKSFGQKLAGTAGAIFKNNPLVKAGSAIGKALKKGASSIGKAVKNSKIGKAVSGVVGKLGKGLANAGKKIADKLKNTKIGKTISKAADKFKNSKVGKAVSGVVGKIKGFFSKKKDKEKDGSHAQGLESVPKDGYQAELHKGESVLSKSAARLFKMAAFGPLGALGGTISNGSGMASALGKLMAKILKKKKDKKGSEKDANKISPDSTEQVNNESKVENKSTDDKSKIDPKGKKPPMMGLPMGMMGGAAFAMGGLFDKKSMNPLLSPFGPMGMMMGMLGKKKKGKDGAKEGEEGKEATLREVVDAIYDQTKVLKAAIEGKSGEGDGKKKDNDPTQETATSRFNVQPKYDEDMTNLSPQMAQ